VQDGHTRKLLVCSAIDIDPISSPYDMPLNKSCHDYNESLIERNTSKL
jgi:hypothetical protein